MRLCKARFITFTLIEESAEPLKVVWHICNPLKLESFRNAKEDRVKVGRHKNKNYFQAVFESQR